MVLNKELFGGNNPFMDAEKSMRLRILAEVREMAICNEREEVIALVTSQERMTNVVAALYDLRDHFKINSIGYNKANELIKEIEIKDLI